MKYEIYKKLVLVQRVLCGSFSPHTNMHTDSTGILRYIILYISLWEHIQSSILLNFVKEKNNYSVQYTHTHAQARSQARTHQ